jgi:2-hydroxychromene-2-carboxylate isomerase
VTLDVWFDYASPFAYLASTQVDALAARTGATLRWRPMLLGAVFRAVGQADVPLYAMSEPKRSWFLGDLTQWAAWWDVPFRYNPHFPLRTVLPLRVTLAAADPGPLVHRLYRAAWVHGLDIADPSVLVDIGVDPALVAAADGQRDALRTNTDEAVARGVFGAPSFVVDDRWLFWGQDRLDQVEDVLRGTWTPPA